MRERRAKKNDSDAIGETAEAVAKATLRQFASEQVKIVRYSHVATGEEIRFIVAEAAHPADCGRRKSSCSASRARRRHRSASFWHKGIKTANYPLMPEIQPPADLGKKPGQLVVGLTMTPEHLLKVRTERLKSIGLSNDAKYAGHGRTGIRLAHDEAARMSGY